MSCINQAVTFGVVLTLWNTFGSHINFIRFWFVGLLKADLCASLCGSGFRLTLYETHCKAGIFTNFNHSV
jgi:hypothetical protein